MKQLGGLVPLLAAVALGWLLSGLGAFSRDGAPHLVSVTDIAPREVEVGDRVAIVGDGFPAGKTARVTFRGTLLRPGERPERGAEIEANGLVVGPQQVEVAFSDATQALFCGAGECAAHTTFDGEVEVAFAAAGAGSPPVAGSLAHVTLDVRPAAAPIDAEKSREGARLLQWIGADAAATPSGVTITSVEPASRADAAGITVGDAVLRFDGVQVASLGDLLPVPGEREATVTLRRAGATAELARTLAVDGFRRAPPADLVLAAPLVLGALALVFLLAAPGRASIASALQRAIARVRPRPAGSLRAAVAPALPPFGPFAVVDVLAFGVFAAMPFGQYLVAARLDVGILFFVAVAMLAASAVLARGAWWSGLSAASHVAWQHVPAAVAVVSVVASTGSLRVQDMAHAQGGWPWDWLAFHDPGSLVALFVLLGAARVDPDLAAAPVGVAAHVDGARTDGVPRPRWLRAACRAHAILVAGLASALFLGGWLLPGVTAAEQAAHPALQLAGAAWLLGKTMALVAAMACLRFASSRRYLGERSRSTALVMLPAALVALAATASWTEWGPERATQMLASIALCVAVGLVGPALALRVRYGLLAPLGDGRVSPFL